MKPINWILSPRSNKTRAMAKEPIIMKLKATKEEADPTSRETVSRIIL